MPILPILKKKKNIIVSVTFSIKIESNVLYYLLEIENGISTNTLWKDGIALYQGLL